MSEIAPCLIIAYSRPGGVRTLLESMEVANVSKVYIAIDGPRDETDTRNRKLILKIVEEYSQKGSMNIQVLARELNLGVGAGVISAIDWFFENEESGIILEDDLVPSRSFFEYSSMCLSQFDWDPEVWVISGTQVFPNRNQPSISTWSHYPMIWGWAGWASKWKLMRTSLLRHKSFKPLLSLSARFHFWRVGANRTLLGKVDTWDIPLAFEFYYQRKLCLLPPVNLISNVGNDSIAAHTGEAGFPLNQPSFEIDLPFVVDSISRDQTSKSYDLKLEAELFKISSKHVLLPIWSTLLDFHRFPKEKRKSPLSHRLRVSALEQLKPHQ